MFALLRGLRRGGLAFGFVTVFLALRVELVHLLRRRLAGAGTLLPLAAARLPHAEFARRDFEQRLIRGLFGGERGGQFVRRISRRGQRRFRPFHFFDGGFERGAVAHAFPAGQHLARLRQRVGLRVVNGDDVGGIIRAGGGVSQTADRQVRPAGGRTARRRRRILRAGKSGGE